MTDTVAPFRVKDLLTRTKDGRQFRVTFVNPKARLFSADSADGHWSSWGGPFPFEDAYTVTEWSSSDPKGGKP